MEKEVSFILLKSVSSVSYLFSILHSNVNKTWNMFSKIGQENKFVLTNVSSGFGIKLQCKRPLKTCSAIVLTSKASSFNNVRTISFIYELKSFIRFTLLVIPVLHETDKQK